LNKSNFASLGLADFLLRALAEEGYENPTPIQAESIRPILEGKDLLGIAQTGTGKTAAFALPLIQRLASTQVAKPPRSARVLVVAPTRELAAQIETSFAAYGRHAGLTRACIFGGVGASPQEKALSRGVDILVATPGRLLDLVDRGSLTLSHIESVVLDEADRMFDMGFIRDIRRIVALLPKARQTILFSATMPPEIAAFAEPIMSDPVRAAVPSAKPTADRVEQKVLFVSKEDKRRLLSAILYEDGFEKVIVFTRTKHGANRLAKQLTSEGIVADAIHANKSQNQRTRAMDSFRSGGTTVLVATDLAARGIDVDEVELVVNFDLPNEPETYVHRIGRTARAGLEGMAVSFCDNDERPLLRDIERFVGFRIPVELDHPFALDIEPLRDPEPRKGRQQPRQGASQARQPRRAGQSQVTRRDAAKDNAPQGQPLQSAPPAREGVPGARGRGRAHGPGERQGTVHQDGRGQKNFRTPRADAGREGGTGRGGMGSSLRGNPGSSGAGSERFGRGQSKGRRSGQRRGPALAPDGLPVSTGAEGLGIAAYFSGQASIGGYADSINGNSIEGWEGNPRGQGGKAGGSTRKFHRPAQDGGRDSHGEGSRRRRGGAQHQNAKPNDAPPETK